MFRSVCTAAVPFVKASVKSDPAPSAALPLLLVRGNRGISTGALFRSLDLGKKPARTCNPSSAMLNALEQGSPADIAAALQNDLLPAAVGFAPEIDRYIAAMRNAGALRRLNDGQRFCRVRNIFGHGFGETRRKSILGLPGSYRVRNNESAAV